MKKIYTIIAALAIATGATAQSFTVHTKDGKTVKYHCSDVDSISFDNEKEPEVVAPRIGDIYYSDGTWSTKLKEGATPIGIVFRVGIASEMSDREGFYTKKDGVTPFDEFHGYVVALRDATAKDDTNEGVWWSAFDSKFTGTGASTNIADFLGYTNTQSIVETAIRDKGELNGSTNNYPATYYATTVYEQTCPAPESSSGWFLPAAGQMEYLFDRVYFDEDGSGRSCVSATFELLTENLATPLYGPDSEYWTSTEKVDSYGTSTWAYYFSFDSSQFKPGFVADFRKNSEMRVRSMLAF